MSIIEKAKAITPYVYSGAIRSGTSHAVRGAQDALASAAPPAVAEFLRSDVGEGLLRLALAGALTIHDLPKLAGLQEDIRQELAVSASACGFDALAGALADGALAVRARLSASQESGE